MKARNNKEYTKQVDLPWGANNRAKKWKIIVGLVIEERKAVSKFDWFYLEILFSESTNKTKKKSEKSAKV